MSRAHFITNFVLFQVAWLACVLGGAHQWPLIGSAIALTVIAVHLWYALQPAQEARLLMAALFLGGCFESLLVNLNLTQYTSGIIHPQLAPYWMMLMWPLFATTLNVSLRWLTVKPLGWSVLLGGVLAPLSYFAGYRLQAVDFPNPLQSLLVIGIGWAVLFPVIVLLARHYNGYQPASEHTQSPWRQQNV